MKKVVLTVVLALLCNFLASAQFGKIKLDKAVDAAAKGVKSFTLSDAEIKGYADEYMQWSDAHNPVCKTTDKDKGMKEVADRLAKIVSVVPANLTKELNLNILSYYVIDVNAFACANGDIRVFAALMDLMTDDQILAVIGHEIGHIVNKDSKDAFATALRVSALKDAAGAVGGNTVQKLNDAQLSDLAESLANAQYSQKQENAADAYGYEFLKKCGKDPNNMASSLGVLLKLQEEAGTPENSKFNKLFSSHPDLKKRIETLNKMN
ncbi:MAG: M48 family metalloprotease [Dysgonamonadaceae bacterium]|jgi:putative metalloprotease|nr:M48 family metalloprotease [Dysgonamonadaceae bacterium]